MQQDPTYKVVDKYISSSNLTQNDISEIQIRLYIIHPTTRGPNYYSLEPKTGHAPTGLFQNIK